MKLKKILGITGVALLSVGVLAACSSKSNTSGTTYGYVYSSDQKLWIIFHQIRDLQNLYWYQRDSQTIQQ